MSWSVLFYREKNGKQPALDFLQNELTNAERSRFVRRVQRVQDKGLNLLQSGSDVLESVKDADNLYSLRLPRSQNNPRFLLCVNVGKTFYILHGFKEKSTSDYDRAIKIAENRLYKLQNP